MLIKIKSFFWEIGHITKNKNTYHYRIMGLKICLVIKTHFTKYPLMTYKQVYFELWSKILDLMVKDSHLTDEGLLQIINIKSAFKMGLNKDLFENFLNSKPEIKPNYNINFDLMNSQWISGFINTDGSFTLNLTKSKSKNKNMDYGIIPMIRIYQDIISLTVLESIKNYLNCGYILKPSSGRSIATLVFSNTESINKIIQICNEIPLLGAKQRDFIDFKFAYSLYLNKEHLNSTGLNKIVKIAQGMNSGRKFD